MIKKLKRSEENIINFDSVDPMSGKIISRKFTQFSEIKLERGYSYLNEMVSKYNRGTRIADVQSNITGSNKEIFQLGDSLQGNLFLEIPVQINPIPLEILNKADELNISIIDINGKIYN